MSDYHDTITETAGLDHYWSLNHYSGDRVEADFGGRTMATSGGYFSIFAVPGASPATGVGMLFGGEGNLASIGSGATWPASTSFSVEAIVNTAGGGNYGVFSAGPGGVLLRVEASGKLALIKSRLALVVESPAAIPLNQWVHVAAVVDAVAGKARLYVNGSKVADVSTAITFDSRDTFTIGSDADATRFAGSIDEVALYGVALDDSQIAARMAARSAAADEPDDRTLRLLFLGDSISVQGVATHNGLLLSAPDITGELLRRTGENGRTVTVTNKAVSSITAAEVAVGIAAIVAVAQANGCRTAMLMLGANDCAPQNLRTKSQYKTDIQTICAALVAAGISVILNYPSWCVWDTTGLLPQYCEALEEIEDEYTGEVVIGDRRAYDYFRTHTNQLLDGVHHNNVGGESLANLWAIGVINAKLSIFPSTADTRSGVAYGPNGDDFTGTLSSSAGTKVLLLRQQA